VAAHSLPRVRKAVANGPAATSRSATNRSDRSCSSRLRALFVQKVQLLVGTSCWSLRYELLREAR